MITIIGLVIGVFFLGLASVRPLIQYCRRHAVDPNGWIMRLVAGWVVTWTLFPLFLRRIFGFTNPRSILLTLAILTAFWYALVWFRLRRAPKGEIFEDKIEEIGNARDKPTEDDPTHEINP